MLVSRVSAVCAASRVSSDCVGGTRDLMGGVALSWGGMGGGERGSSWWSSVSHVTCIEHGLPPSGRCRWFPEMAGTVLGAVTVPEGAGPVYMQRLQLL